MVQKKSNPKKTAPKAESTAEEPKKKVVARKTATKSAKDDQPAVEPKAKAKSSKKAEPESTVKTEPVAETKKTVKSKKVTATAVEEMPKAVEPKPKAAAKKKTIPPKEAVPDVEVQSVAEPAAEPKKTKKKTAKADAKPAPAPVVAAPEVVAQPVAEPVAEPAAEPAAAPKKTKKKTAKADAKPEAAPVEAAPEVVAQPAAEPEAAPKKSKKKTAKADANQVPVEEPKAVEAVEEVQKEAPKKRSARLTAPRKGNKVIVEDYIMEEAYSGTFQPIVRAKEDPVSGIAKKPVPVVDESNIDANIPVEEAKKTVRKPRTKRAAKVDLEDFISKEPDSPSVEDLPSETSNPDEPEVENTAAVEAVTVPKKKGGRKPSAKKAKDGLSSKEASEDVSLDLDKQEPSAEDLENLPEEVFDEMEAVKAKSRKPEEPKVLREPRPREDRPANVYEVESVLDINSFNIWNLNEFMIAELWENERKETDFSQTEEKLLNIIRTAFDLVHYDEGNARDKALYDNGDWAHFSHCRPGRGTIAIRRRLIRKLTDLTYENIRHITAPTLLELIDRNFGGGWDSISLSIKDIIESGFDISTTQLPANRIHLPGGTLERKVAQGYDVLELARGTWIEAIFAKKKDPIEKLHYELLSPMFDEDGNELPREAPEEDPDMDEEDEDETDDVANDENYYSNYAAEANVKDEDEEGFPIVEAD